MDPSTAAPKPQRRVILAASHLGAGAEPALRQAHQRADAEGAELVVCHVVPEFLRVPMWFRERLAPQERERMALRQRAREALAEQTSRVTGRSPGGFRVVIDAGIPYACIVKQAERLHAELVVVGAHGATRSFPHALLGGVAGHVVRYAHAPVLVARESPASGIILAASDLSDPARPALAAAANEARRRPRARVIGLHCVEPPVYVPPRSEFPLIDPELLDGLVQHARERADLDLAHAFSELGLSAEQRVHDGAPTPAILSTARQLGAELLVLGTRGRTGLRRVVLGSVAEAVVRGAPCSALVVRLHEGDLA